VTRPTLSWFAAAALAATLTALPLSAAFAQNKGEVKIALIASKSGPLEAYAKQTIVGFNLGLEYATGGTMMVRQEAGGDREGRPGQARRGQEPAGAAYADDKVDIAVGPTASGVALAMLPVAEEYKKILLVEPAVADSITGDKWNKYIFRTGRNSSQDAIANAVALDQAGTSIATLAQDNAFGRDGVKAFKDAVKKAKIVHEEYLPTGTTDFTAGRQRIIDKLKDQPGRKVIWIIWAGRQPVQDRRHGPEALRHRDRHRRQHPAGDGGLQAVPGHGRRDLLLLRHPEEQGQRLAGGRHYSQFKAPPDFFTAGGMLRGMAVVEALKKTGGDTNTNKLIARWKA
jgi:branched-chain amino acid transport system substrate-binding protein